MRLPGRRRDVDDPTEEWGDEACAGGRELAVPEGYWPSRAHEDQVAAESRTRRVPLMMAGWTLLLAACGWGLTRLVSVFGGPDAAGLVGALVWLATWAAVPVLRASLRARIADEWARTWWVATALAAVWIDVVVAVGAALVSLQALLWLLAVLVIGTAVMAARWNDAHEVPDPAEDGGEFDAAADPEPPAPVPAIAVRVPELDPATADALRIEEDWAEYVADGENAIALRSELRDRTQLAYGWRWTIQLDRRGSTTAKLIATDEKADSVALKLVRRSNHVMIEQLSDGNDRADLAMLTVVTRDVLADGVPYTGPNYDRGVIRVGQYADGTGDAQWIAYNDTGVQSGLITGDPRSGKSAFLAKLAADFKASGEWNVLFADGDRAGGSAPVLAEIADDLARGNEEILQQLEGLEAVQHYVRGDLMATLTIGPDGKPMLMTHPGQTPADKMLPCPQYPGLVWFLDEFHNPAGALRSANFANRVEKVVRGLAKYGLAVIVSTQSKLGADFGGSGDLRAMLAKNEISFRAENKEGIGVVGDGSTDPSTLPRGGGYAFLGHGERHAMIRTEFTKDPATGGSNMYQWVPQIQAAGVPMDDLTAAVYRRFRPVKVLDRVADHAERTGRLDALRAAVAAGAPLPGSPEAAAAEKTPAAAAGGEIVGLPSLSSVVVPFRPPGAEETRPDAQPAPAPAPLSKNARSVLEALQSRPGAWRSAEIIDHTRLSAPAVSKALRELVDAHLAHRPSGVRGVHASGPQPNINSESEAV